MFDSHAAPGRCLAAAFVILLLAACSSPRYRAPVEDRSSAPPPASSTAAPTTADSRPTASIPDTSNAGKAGYVTVKPGDTLMRIASESGQNWRDIVRWNNLSNPDVIEVGQALRIAPPSATDIATPVEGPVAAKPITTGRVEARPLDARAIEAKPIDAKASDAKPVAVDTKPVEGRPADVRPAPGLVVSPSITSVTPSPAAPSGATVATGAAPVTTTAPAAAPSASGDESIVWLWPAAGTVGTTFDGPRNKGVTILGKAGDPVVASADGRVIYAGSSLRGYGNVIIIKHNATYITAYAHNRALLVKDEQVVRKGQRIAEMGSSDTDRVQLHFEVRKNGVAVDPLKHLPAR